MGIFNKSNLIELNQDDLQDAKTTAGLFHDDVVQRRAFANVIGARAALKLLFSLNIDATNLYSMYSINRILERLDISDINVGNIRLDVRLVDNSNEIFIPKSHFELGIIPDLYVILRLQKDLSCVEFLGCINPDEIDKTNQNNDYYLVSDELLYNLKIFKNLIKNDNAIRTNYFLTPENIERAQNLIVPFLDGDIFTADYAFLIRHLAYDVNLRQKCVEFENFEFVSKKVVSDESIYGDSVLGLIGADNLYESNELNTNVDLDELSETTVDDFVEDFGSESQSQMNELTGEISLNDSLAEMDEKFLNDNIQDENFEHEDDNEVSVLDSDVIENLDNQQSFSDIAEEEQVEEDLSNQEIINDENSTVDDDLKFQSNLQINQDIQENIPQYLEKNEDTHDVNEIINEAEEILSEQELINEEDKSQEFSDLINNSDEFIQENENEVIQSDDVFITQNMNDKLIENENITLDEFLNASDNSIKIANNEENISDDTNLDYIYNEEIVDDEEIEPEMLMNNNIENDSQNLYSQDVENLNTIPTATTTNKKHKFGFLKFLILVIMIASVYINRESICYYFDTYFPSISSKIREFNIEIPSFDFTKENNNFDKLSFLKNSKNFNQMSDTLQGNDTPLANQQIDNLPEQVEEYSQQNKVDLNNINTNINVTKLSWEVPESAANNLKIRKYLQIVGRTLKLSLQNDLLVINDVPFTNKVVIDLKIANSGKLLSSDFIVSSGSKQIDNIILQTVSDTLKYVKPPVGEIQSSCYNFTLIINF